MEALATDSAVAAHPPPPYLQEVAPRSRAFEPVAFAALYDEHARFVFRACVRLGVADGDVDDAVQEVFLVLHRRLDDFAGRSSLRTWLYGIAVGVARNCRRARIRRRLDAFADDGAADCLPAPSERAPDAQLARGEAAERLLDVLAELDEASREVFVLAELEAMSAVEIAEALGLKVNTVYSRLRIARRGFEDAVRRARARDAWRSR